VRVAFFACATWLSVSAAAVVIENVVFFWIFRQGVPVGFVVSRVPRLLSNAYVDWCKERGRIPNGRRLRLGRVLSWNLLASLLLFSVVGVAYMGVTTPR